MNTTLMWISIACLGIAVLFVVGAVLFYIQYTRNEERK